MSLTTASENPHLRSAISKATLRIIPFLFLLYIVAYLDRVNVSFAKLQMGQAIGLTETLFGTGSGIFFIGYAFFEVPSNLILEKVGARIWIARIMILWGVIAAAMALVNSVSAFMVMRVLLGIGEAGFFPGMILYLTYWFPAKERARAIALFMTATTLSNVIGSPISGLILKNVHGLGLAGWQWLYILEGLPACFLGVVVLFYLTDKPEKADWLTPEEREALIGQLRSEHERKLQSGHHPSLKALLDPRVALLCLIYFCNNTGSYAVSMWIPQIIKDSITKDEMLIGLYAAFPYACAAIFMVLNGLHSDRTGERKFHAAGSIAMAAIGLAGSALTHDYPFVALGFLALAAMGTAGALGPFWSLPTSFLGGTAAAGGIALINSIGNLGGYVGPQMVGYLKDTTHGFTIPLMAVSLVVICGAITVTMLKHDRSLEHPDAAAA